MTGNQAFRDYVARLQAQHGDKFSTKDLSENFASHFGPEYRVKVRFSYGEEKWGYVSGTTGWTPSLMLMHNRRARGSSNLLGKGDTLLEVRGVK
jgi:hypothetical protein